MGHVTHEVANQVPPLTGYDVFGTDAALVEAVGRHADDDAVKRLHDLGRLAGSAEVQHDGELANTYPPVLRTHDRYGYRVDEVDFHPSWHTLMRTAVEYGLAGGPWRADGGGPGHVERAAAFAVWTQVEAGHLCPVSMTHAAVPALVHEPAVAAEWAPRLTAPRYDPGLRPPDGKAGCLAGMGMTEKQGGSDVRANTTRAQPLAADGEYVLTGHKWFCSAPMSDVFLVLAQAPGGLTCFLVPRVLPDGARNAFRLQRLKDKLGNRSNASAEIELDAAWARRIGDEGRGVRTIIGMVASTRLDCISGSAALMRQAVAQATHHAAHRSAFGRILSDQPLMRNVLADLALESEAATALVIRLAATFDSTGPNSTGTEHAGALRRLGLTLGKYWVTKRAPAVTAEAMECLGGNGYVEESGMPRIYREAPLNSIWEGPGNVNALDVLRALGTEPATLDAYLAEVALAEGTDRRLDAAVTDLLRELADADSLEWRARRLVERMALVLQASLLVRFAPAAVADAFTASRLTADSGATFGTLPRGVDAQAIIQRTTPRIG